MSNVERNPREIFPPSWWDSRGYNFDWEGAAYRPDKDKEASWNFGKKLTLRSNQGTEQVKMNPYGIMDSSGYSPRWSIRYEVTHSPEISSIGSFSLSPKELLEAFGRNENPEISESNNFIRQGRFLNIPRETIGKLSGHSISIFLTDKIINAVEELLKEE